MNVRFDNNSRDLARTTCRRRRVHIQRQSVYTVRRKKTATFRQQSSDVESLLTAIETHLSVYTVCISSSLRQQLRHHYSLDAYFGDHIKLV